MGPSQIFPVKLIFGVKIKLAAGFNSAVFHYQVNLRFSPHK